VVERWALPPIKKVRYSDSKLNNLPGCCFEDASCEARCDPRTKEEQVDTTTHNNTSISVLPVTVHTIGSASWN